MSKDSSPTSDSWFVRGSGSALRSLPHSTRWLKRPSLNAVAGSVAEKTLGILSYQKNESATLVNWPSRFSTWIQLKWVEIARPWSVTEKSTVWATSRWLVSKRIESG